MRNVLLTGATGGIGTQLALLLAQQISALTVVGRDEKELIALQRKVVEKHSFPVDYLVADLRLSDDVKVLEEYIAQHSFDLIVNNAAFGLYGKMVELPLQEQIAMIDVNVRALVSITWVGARRMLSLGLRGTILNVSSLAGFFPTPLMAVYGATKSFVTSFSEAVDYEMSQQGIRVLAYCPGMVATSFAEKAAKKLLPTIKHRMSPQKAARQIIRQIKKGCGLEFPKAAYYGAHLLPHKWRKKMIYQSIEKRIT